MYERFASKYERINNWRADPRADRGLLGGDRDPGDVARERRGGPGHREARGARLAAAERARPRGLAAAAHARKQSLVEHSGRHPARPLRLHPRAPSAAHAALFTHSISRRVVKAVFFHYTS